MVPGRPAVEADQPQAHHLEAQLDAQVPKQRHVAQALVAEVEVLPHHDQGDTQSAYQHLADERLCRLGRSLRVERQHHGQVHAGGGQFFQLLVGVGEQQRGRTGTHHAGRVTVEGEDGRGEAPFDGQPADL